MKLLRRVMTHSGDQIKPESPNLYRHIVVALDGSAAAERVLPYVEALARGFGSRVTLLRAVTPIEEALMGDEMARAATRRHPAGPTLTKPSQYNAIAYLDAVQQPLLDAGLKVETECPEGQHAEAIVQRARRLNADLIAMTTHGRSGLRRAVIGSVADEVIRTAHCPVLLVRLDSQEGQAPGV